MNNQHPDTTEVFDALAARSRPATAKGLAYKLKWYREENGVRKQPNTHRVLAALTQLNAKGCLREKRTAAGSKYALNNNH
jgi:hypothetical protein|tara:strand:+ start:537 stop:776 length:240 start_codon:yes stop_codon:yes gene_type:complete